LNIYLLVVFVVNLVHGYSFFKTVIIDLLNEFNFSLSDKK
jgi:hypothetical protein